MPLFYYFEKWIFCDSRQNMVFQKIYNFYSQLARIAML